MPTGSVDPSQSTSAIGSIKDVRIGTTGPDRVERIDERSARPGTHAQEYVDPDRMEVHVDGVARRAYAQFMAHPKTGQVSIKIIDADTKQVVREIPSEEVIRLAEQLQQYWEMRHKRVEAR